MANRVTFLVDGFNLHFSVRHAETARKTSHLRWLDVSGLLSSFLSLFGREATLEGVHFFAAIPLFLHRRDPQSVLAFRTYLQVLEASGVHLHIADFKRKSLICPHCGEDIDRYEEKETDVALGVKALELLHLQACDTLVIVSGDTDFAPAMRTAKRLFPTVQVCVAFPHARFNAELQQIADFSFRIRAARYAEHQLPDPVRLSDARVIRRPKDW
ncbi:MAG: NYN domain-containing protein [Longimicrobiales bacterium]